MSSPPPSGAAWRPLLEGGDRARALEAVTAIAEDLVDAPRPPRPPRARQVTWDSLRPSVLTGHAGKALFYAYLEDCCPGAGFGERGVEHVEQAIELLAESENATDLYSGFTGVGFSVELLQEFFLDPPESDDEDPNSEVDRALELLLGVSPWPGDYDLVSGLVGYGVYALRRLPRPAAVTCLELLVDRLEELAVERPVGRTWYTPAEKMPEDAREFFVDGYDNLGTAHGVPGVIAMLARICAAGVACAKARPLLDSAVEWLLAQKLDGADSIFPTAVGESVEVRFSRAAWCYGDPGVAAALLVAARAVGVEEWEAEALSFARHSACRPEETTYVRDCCLCHGAVGLAHLFNRMYQATGEELLREGALGWYRRVLDLRRPGEGIGGYLSFRPAEDDEGEGSWRADPTFLSGAVGLGLALLGGISSREPRWDELLVVSPLAPRAG